MTAPLGKLEEVAFKNIWENEDALDKWLVTAEGLALLEKTLGAGELEVVGRQVLVGAFKADIVLQEVGRENSTIVVENQLNETNHDHLGKVLTYAAGLGVRQVVWIAETFRDEHRATIDWLNQRTDNETGFTGLEIELWRIGGSKAAPKFKVVSHVNEWSRSAKPIPDVFQHYWISFKNYIKGEESEFQNFNSHGTWATHTIGKAFCHFQTVWKPINSTMRTELYFFGDRINGHKSLDFIEKNLRENFDKEVSENLDFIKTSVVYLSGRIVLHQHNVDINDEERWPEYHKWYEKTLNQFKEVFMPIIENLDVNQFPPVRVKDK